MLGQDASAYSDAQASERFHRSDFLIGGEVSQISLPGLSLSGLGLNVAYRFGLTPKFAIRPQVSQVLGTTGGTFLYTSIGGFLTYALTGSNFWGSSTINFEGRPVASVTIDRRNTFSVGAGFEQMFLNGNQSTYSAPGFGVVASYDRKIFGQWLSFLARYSQFESNQQPIKGIIFNVSVPISF